MFTYRTIIRLKQTDATGVLYFTEYFQLAMETFEEFLQFKGFSLRDLSASAFLMPVVHSEGDFQARFQVGERVEVALEEVVLGGSSLTLSYTLNNLSTDKEAGRVKIIHVVIDRASGLPIPIPEVLRELLILPSSVM